MSKILTVSVLIFISFLTLGNSTELVTLNETVYEKNLNTVSLIFIFEWFELTFFFKKVLLDFRVKNKHD